MEEHLRQQKTLHPVQKKTQLTTVSRSISECECVCVAGVNMPS